MSEECNVGNPHASRDSYNNPFIFPNGDSGGVYEFRKGCHRRKRTFEARSTMKTRRGLGKLEPGEKGKNPGLRASSSKIGVRRGAYKLGNHRNLGNMRLSEGGLKDAGSNMAHTSQLIGVVTSRFKKMFMATIARVATRMRR